MFMMLSNPKPQSLVDQSLHDEVQEWLQTKGTSLWADWLITSEDGLQEATDWFVQELRAFWRHRMRAYRPQVSGKNFDVV